MSADQAVSVLRWWLEMGVDVAVQDEPRDWLRPAAPVPAGAASGSTTSDPAVSRVAEPQTLFEFRQWLAEAPPPPFAAASSARVLPHGAEGAAVMLLADLPGSDDMLDGRPIGGEARILAERMLAAIGIKPDEAYVASLACFHAPGARLGPEELADCAALARRHVALARPQRLLLLGDTPARALLGKPLTQARGHAHKVEGVRTVATFAPRQLLRRPSDKALAWKDLLLLMEDEA